jgi:hypothetical protein
MKFAMEMKERQRLKRNVKCVSLRLISLNLAYMYTCKGGTRGEEKRSFYFQSFEMLASFKRFEESERKREMEETYYHGTKKVR